MKFFCCIVNVLLLIVVLLSCNDNKKHEKIYYFDTGEIWKKVVYENEDDTTNNYLLYGYYRMGKIAEVIECKDSVIIGKRFYYGSDTNLSRVSSFLKDYVSGNRKEHGITSYYSVNGKKSQEDFYLFGSKRVMKKSYSKDSIETAWVYHDVFDDGVVESRGIMYEKNNELIREKSFGVSVFAPDTINYGEEYTINIDGVTYAGKGFLMDVFIGELNEDVMFVNEDEVIELHSDSLHLEYTFIPRKTGSNLFMGRVRLKKDTIIDGRDFSENDRGYILYKEFYVKEEE